MKELLNNPVMQSEIVMPEQSEPSAVDQAEKILSMCEKYKKKNRLNKQILRLGKQQKKKFKKMSVYVEEA